MNEKENTLQVEIDDQFKLNKLVVENIENQDHINNLTNENINMINEAFKNQELLNKINQETISKHGESIRWLLISNVALIIALAVLLIK
ncbi:hypothetical protein [Acetobacterium wieringae]|uniref:hypothetical protein n=1 Tax=Acetobacterium wieringae TaxID=52694 RepID=UPI0020334A00|nr:hypothetical protein [Acetobacterium wieringae]URN85186.1 hypothetical protein CHL1_000817 [Acetobacterium wieringae]